MLRACPRACRCRDRHTEKRWDAAIQAQSYSFAPQAGLSYFLSLLYHPRTFPPKLRDGAPVTADLRQVGLCAAAHRLSGPKTDASFQPKGAAFLGVGKTRFRTIRSVYPPAIAPRIRKGSAPDATALGRGASGGS